MARHLYRFYLYIVFIALVIFAAIATGGLLNTLLTFTPLRGEYNSAPSTANIVQSVVFALVTLLIAGALAGLHYWLIRRDMRADPEARESAIRALLLNLTEAMAVSLAVPFIGFSVFNSLAQYPRSNVATPIAFALPALAVALLLELERRRAPATAARALTFQRLHFYALQLFFLLFLLIDWPGALTSITDTLLFANKGSLESCGEFSLCNTPNAFWLILSLLWFLGCWLGYNWLMRNDHAPLLRLLTQYISFGAGVSFILAGLYKASQLVFLDIAGRAPAFKEVVGPNASYNFFAFLIPGLTVILCTHFWLRQAEQLQLVETKVRNLTEVAVVAVLGLGVFWWGCGTLLYNLFQLLFATPPNPDTLAWSSAWSLFIAGAGSIAFDLYLWQQNRLDPLTALSPRRGEVLTLVAGGVLSFAIGGAVSLYTWLTALFGSPLQNWQLVLHSALATFLVGVVLLAIYLVTAWREQLFAARHTTPTPEPVPDSATAKSVTLEEILDELLAGKLTRDEAATRIRQQEHTSEHAEPKTEIVNTGNA